MAIVGYFLGTLIVTWLIFIVPFLGLIDIILRKGKEYGMIFPFACSVYAVAVFYIIFYLVFTVGFTKSIKSFSIPAIIGFIWGTIYVLFGYFNFYKNKYKHNV